MGAWFGVLPCKLPWLNLRADIAESCPPPDVALKCPPFRQTVDETKRVSKKARELEAKAVEEYNATTKQALETAFSLDSGTGERILGGVHVPETDLTSTFIRFFQAVIPDCVSYQCNLPLSNPWVDKELGVTSNYRPLRQLVPPHLSRKGLL